MKKCFILLTQFYKLSGSYQEVNADLQNIINVAKILIIDSMNINIIL